jgi:hypothetical protein
MTTDTLHELVETAIRLEYLRNAPPSPLRLEHHDHDHPARSPDPLKRPPSRSGSARPQGERFHGFDWRSRKVGP